MSNGNSQNRQGGVKIFASTSIRLQPKPEKRVNFFASDSNTTNGSWWKVKIQPTPNSTYLDAPRLQLRCISQDRSRRVDCVFGVSL